MNERGGRIELEGAPQRGKGAAGVTRPIESEADVEIDRDAERIELARLLDLHERLVETARRAQEVRVPLVRLGVVRVERERLPELPLGPGEVAFVLVAHVREAGVRARK